MQPSSESQQTQSLSNSDTKLFKLNSTGNWDDVGTGKATITRNTTPMNSLDILLNITNDLKEEQDQSKQVSKAASSQESYVFEGVTNFSIQSGSILVFMSRQKRFALSFKDSDTGFSQFFSSQIKSSDEKMVQQVNPQSMITGSNCEDDNLLQGIKTSFYKYEQEKDDVSLFETFKAFRRLLNQCKEDFIRLMFSEQNIQFLFAVLEYSYHNSSRVAYRNSIKNISYQNMLELPPHIEKYAKFNMYLSQFKDIASLVIQPGLQSLITLFTYENGTTIINYILLNPSVIKNLLMNIQQNIPKIVKLLNELMTLASSVSLDTRTRLFNYLISQKGGNIYSRLAKCLNNEMIKQQVNSESQEVTTFQNIIDIYLNVSAINTPLLQNYIAQIFLTQEKNIRKQNTNGSEFCQALVFGYLQGNINLKSRILELLSNIFNPDSIKTYWANQSNTKSNQVNSHSIYRLIDRKILSPICKQLFKKNHSYSGEQLMMEWIAKMFPYFNIILRRVIIDSGLIKKALQYSSKKTILLLLILKLLKGMLQIKNNNSTVRYLKNSGTIASLQKAYIKNNGKHNLIGSLFLSISQDLRQTNYDTKSQKQLQRIFQNTDSNYQ